MKNSFLLLLFSIICIIQFNVHAVQLRVATYNLWNPLFEAKYTGQDTWNERLPFIINTILSSESDILCLQEVGKKSYLDLIQNSEINSRYMSFYISHAPSTNEQQEGRDGIAFLYRPEKVALRKLVQSLDGSRPTHRRDFFVDLIGKEELVPFKLRIACTHLDSEKNLSIGNAQLSALVKDILEMNNAREIDFVIVCGDFNEGEEESLRPRYEIMDNAGFFTDGSVEATRPEALDVRHKGHVDWIYFKRLSPMNFCLTPLSPIGDEKGSDHKLTMTDIEIE